MPRFPKDAVEAALNDDGTRIGRPVHDPSPAPQKPGLLKRIYNYVVGDNFVETNTPLKRTTEIPRITDAEAPMASARPYVTEPAQLTIEELEKKYAWMTPEEFDAKVLEISHARRARRLAAIPGHVGTDIRKPVMGPIPANDEDDQSEGGETESTADPADEIIEEMDDAGTDSDADADADTGTDADADADEIYENLDGSPVRAPVSGGGGRVVLGNAALATIVVAMALFQS